MNDWLPPLNHTFSPHTGWTRDHWVAVLARLSYGFVLAAQRQGSPARALFPGDQCDRPDAVDGLEAVSRIGVAWGSWLQNPANPDTLHFDGHAINLPALLRQALLDGTNPNNPRTYWGDIAHMDQRIVEASGLALTVWLSKDRVFDVMTQPERDQVIRWLAQVDGKDTWPDNWILFPAISQIVRLHLGYPISETDLDWRLEQMAAFYRGDGWYADGEGDEFDLYNAWMFGCHYLLWAWIDGERRPDHRELVLKRARTFLDGFQYFFGANGSYVAWGRSLQGRFVATVCFQIGHLLKIAPSNPGMLRRIASGCLRYFIDHDFFDPQEHYARQGFHGQTPQAGESYVAPPSPLSACHALFALAFDSTDPFWTETESPLPVEQADFDIAFPVAGLCVSGRRATGQVLLLNGRSGHPADVPRPGYIPKYGKFTYSTHFPFNVSPVADSYAPDAMLALTHDGKTFGHRDTTRAGLIAPGFILCDFDELVADQPQHLRVAVLLWGHLQVRLAFIQPTLPVQAFEAPGTLGCKGAACVTRCSDLSAGWEYAEADGRAIAIQRLLGYDSQQVSASFLDHGNLNLAYRYAEQPLVSESQLSAAPRPFAAASLVRPVPFDPAHEFSGLTVTANPNQSFQVTFAEGEEAFVALGNIPPQSATVNGIKVEGDDLRLFRANRDATCLTGLGVRNIAGVAELHQSGLIQLSKESETGIRLVTDTGVSLANEWLGKPPRRIEALQIGGAWCDITNECQGGVIPQAVVQHWSQQTLRSLVEFRITV
jgi:hypothetical protein